MKQKKYYWALATNGTLLTMRPFSDHDSATFFKETYLKNSDANKVAVTIRKMTRNAVISALALKGWKFSEISDKQGFFEKFLG
jgi:hypothetical protein